MPLTANFQHQQLFFFAGLSWKYDKFDVID